MRDIYETLECNTKKSTTVSWRIKSTTLCVYRCVFAFLWWYIVSLWLEKICLNGAIDPPGRWMAARQRLNVTPPPNPLLPPPPPSPGPGPRPSREPLVNQRLRWKQHRSPLTTADQQVDELGINKDNTCFCLFFFSSIFTITQRLKFSALPGWQIQFWILCYGLL